MKQFYFFIFTFLFFNIICSQNTYVPDDGFEQLLIDLSIDNGPMDNYVPTENLEAQEDLFISQNYNITDLTGLEAFTNIYTLSIANNPISTLDLSGNPYLYTLRLINLNITNVNLAGLIYLEEVTIRGNSISTIDLTAQPNLKILNIEGSLITNLDLSYKSFLEELLLVNNQLTSLNVKNNNNSSIYVFNATGNPNLNCIQVDNQVNAIAATGAYSSWLKDATASYAENCNVLSSNTFKTNTVSIYPNPIKSNQILQFKNIDSNFTFSLYDISCKLIERKLITNNQYKISGLAKGIYSYIVQSDNDIISNKLIILD